MTRAKEGRSVEASTSLLAKEHRILERTSMLWSACGMKECWRICYVCSKGWRYGCLHGNPVAHIPEILTMSGIQHSL